MAEKKKSIVPKLFKSPANQEKIKSVFPALYSAEKMTKPSEKSRNSIVENNRDNIIYQAFNDKLLEFIRYTF